MTTNRLSVVPVCYKANPRNRATQSPSGRVSAASLTPAGGVRMAVRFIRDNRELAVLAATFVLALVLGVATRGMAWV